MDISTENNLTSKNGNQQSVDAEILAFLDDESWIWPLVQRTLSKQGNNFLRLPSSTAIRSSWDRFKLAPRIIVHWESIKRSGGAIVEEILDVAPHFDVADRIIVLSTNPTHEDVVYFSELGIRRIMQIRSIDKQLQISARELEGHITNPPEKTPVERAWRKLLMTIDALPKDPDDSVISDLAAKLEEINKTSKDPSTARYLEAKATLTALAGDGKLAREYWEMTIEKNPKYYRAYNNLINFLRRNKSHKEAFALMQKMQELNKSNISRLVAMGELHLDLADDERAEHYFKSALDRDDYSAGALNGMAEILFRQGDLEESRELLSRSHQADKTASKLNSMGIQMVKEKDFAKALEHYTKAQYVLPQQEKGPMLFYNIGLCYFRWGRSDLACEFLKIALIKEPGYQKARDLLGSIQGGAKA